MKLSRTYWTISVKSRDKNGKRIKEAAGRCKRLRLFIGPFRGYHTKAEMEQWAETHIPVSLLKHCEIHEQAHFSG